MRARICSRWVACCSSAPPASRPPPPRLLSRAGRTKKRPAARASVAVPAVAQAGAPAVVGEAGVPAEKATMDDVGLPVDRFLDGPMVITLRGRSAPTHQESKVARCALTLQ